MAGDRRILEPAFNVAKALRIFLWSCSHLASGSASNLNNTHVRSGFSSSLSEKDATAQQDGRTCPELSLEHGAEKLWVLILPTHSSLSDTTPNLPAKDPSICTHPQINPDLSAQRHLVVTAIKASPLEDLGQDLLWGGG